MTERQQARDALIPALEVQTYTVSQLSNLLHISKTAIRKYIRGGRLEAFYLGPGLRVTHRDLMKFQEEMKKGRRADMEKFKGRPDKTVAFGRQATD